MPDAIPLQEQISEVQRELNMRKRVYPNLLARGTMTHKQQVSYTLRMEAVLATLMELYEKGKLL